jgi:hypothetical protein
METGTNASLLAKRFWGKIKTGASWNFEQNLQRIRYIMSEFGVTWEDIGTDEKHAKHIIKRHVIVLIKYYALISKINAHASVAAYSIKRLMKEYEISADDKALKDVVLPELPSDEEMGSIEILREPEAAA